MWLKCQVPIKGSAERLSQYFYETVIFPYPHNHGGTFVNSDQQ